MVARPFRSWVPPSARMIPGSRRRLPRRDPCCSLATETSSGGRLGLPRRQPLPHRDGPGSPAESPGLPALDDGPGLPGTAVRAVRLEGVGSRYPFLGFKVAPTARRPEGQLRGGSDHLDLDRGIWAIAESGEEPGANQRHDSGQLRYVALGMRDCGVWQEALE
jgi:hypothetical protein